MHYAEDGQVIENDTMTDINAELRCFNWGAFFLGWIWAIFNGAWQSVWPIFLLQLICFILSFFFLGFLFWLLIIALGIYMGVKGNEWSFYGAKKWKNLEHFREIQRIWGGASLVASIFLNSINLALFTLISIIKPKSPKVPKATVETSRMLKDAKNSEYPTLQGISGVNYSFKTLKPDTLSYLKTKSEYKDYFTGQKLVIYFTGADCPYSEIFETAFEPIKNNQEYASKYNFYGKDASGYKSYATMEEANAAVNFENSCHEFCILNTKNGQIFAIDGIGESEAKYISSIIEQLQDW